MAQLLRSTKRHKIEPLNYLEMALAPALKGGISLLEISPEEVRSGHFLGVIHHEEISPVDKVSSPLSHPGTANPIPHDGTQGWEGVWGRPGYVSSPGNEKYPGDEKYPGNETYPDPDPDASAHDHADIADVISISARSAPRTPVSGQRAGVETYPGDETISGRASSGTAQADILPGRGRSQVRRCVLAQDGHSLGEEAIYQVMWRNGRSESNDLNASRTVRIGAADLGIKINMAKKNVRQNIARLFEKLSIEILEDFNTMSSQARFYRVFSYKQILDRRRAVGLEYVVRNKGVVFCTSTGSKAVSSPAYVSTPGDETSLRPAKPKGRRPPKSVQPAPIAPFAFGNSEQSELTELEVVSTAMNRYWPVDEPATTRLIRECRRVRPDARAEEIAFFIGEKLELTRQNRNITNPTGLILATVPKCFVGTTFDKFRRGLEERAALEAEEKTRKAREQKALNSWVVEERERLERTINDERIPEKERLMAEKKLRQIATWRPQ